MLLLHTVLAVVCGGILVSARPEPVRGRDWYGEDTEFTDANVPSYHVQHSDPADSDELWEWAPQGPQHVLGTPPHHADGFPFPGADRKNWPELPHPFSGPPQKDGPEPPQFSPEPHYPPPPPGPPGPPGPPPPPPPPPKDGPPHFPHPPHFPKPGGDTKEQTVYQFLEGHPKFSRLFKLVNYTEDITNLLNDSAQSITFFALPDFGFPKPPHRPDSDEDFEFEDPFQMREGSVGDMLATAEGYLNSVRKPDEGMIKAFLKYVLLYNILPENTPLQELGKNNSFATALKLPDGSLDGEPLRVRLQTNLGLDPRPSVNFISKVLVPDIPVKNGLIHVVNKPVLPPPSIFQIGFLLQNAFSTFTSALQRVGLTDELDFRNVEDGSVQGEPAVSVFAPTNKAFAKLPPKLQLFLFSPFGEKALKKLLQFHIVPKAVVHSNYFHNASRSEFALPRDNSETGEFFGNIDYHLEEWAAISEERFDDEDSLQSNAWREKNCGSGGPPSWENNYQHGYGVPPPFPPPPPGGPFPHEGPNEGPHFPYPGDVPQHHGWPSTPASFPSPPEVWLHYPPPPPPPHYAQNGPGHPPPPPPLPRRRLMFGFIILRLPCLPKVLITRPTPRHLLPLLRRSGTGPTTLRPRTALTTLLPSHLLRLPTALTMRLTSRPRRHLKIGLTTLLHHRHLLTMALCSRPAPAALPRSSSRSPVPTSSSSSPSLPRPSPCSSVPPPPPPFENWPHHPPPGSPGGPHSPPPPPGKLPKGSPNHRPEVVYSVNTTMPTLLENFPLHLKVVQVAFKGPLPKKPSFASYHTIVVAHGQPVAVPDIAARNGAVHVITKLLNPFKKPGNHVEHEVEDEEPTFGPFAEEEDDWAGWEEWLPRWAEEDD
ncbi:hypothetical protein GSI_13468 [Ganoderma sinense ZZ0214-1]|uniref:FAS1 domain-containing protein n=1 Tax=Ganoderma sinense ZZ0214-1 TaxID=1077348 RepID=A0A2G8RQV6_9APHY|nr:hypothetical protein GSI_13468 [Ganoderma sinense ZZ0214-1]